MPPGEGRSAIGSPCPPLVEPLERRSLLSAALTAEFAAPPPASLLGGDSARVAVRVTNTGDLPASGAAVTVFASTDAVLDATDVPLGSTDRGRAIKPGKSATLKPRLSVPTDLPDGKYFLLASAADRPAGQSPLDVSAAPAAVPVAVAVAVSPTAVAVAQPVVELSAALADVPAEVRSASGRHRVSPKERVSVVVANAGTVAARSPGVAVYLSTDAAFDPAVDQRLASKTVGGKLRPGQERTVRVGFRLPAGVPGGAYHLIAVADPAGRFAEPDEANNVVVAPVTVTVVRGHLADRGDRYYDGSYFGVGAGGDCGCGYVPTYDDYDDGGDYVTPPPDTQPSTQPSTQPDPSPPPEPDPTPAPDPTPPADPAPSDSGGFWDFDYGFEDWWG